MYELFWFFFFCYITATHIVFVFVCVCVCFSIVQITFGSEHHVAFSSNYSVPGVYTERIPVPARPAYSTVHLHMWNQHKQVCVRVLLCVLVCSD